MFYRHTFYAFISTFFPKVLVFCLLQLMLFVEAEEKAVRVMCNIYMIFTAVFRFRIHWFRIRIQHLRVNTDPDPVSGSWSTNLIESCSNPDPKHSCTEPSMDKWLKVVRSRTNLPLASLCTNRFRDLLIPILAQIHVWINSRHTITNYRIYTTNRRPRHYRTLATVYFFGFDISCTVLVP